MTADDQDRDSATPQDDEVEEEEDIDLTTPVDREVLVRDEKPVPDEESIQDLDLTPHDHEVLVKDEKPMRDEKPVPDNTPWLTPREKRKREIDRLIADHQSYWKKRGAIGKVKKDAR